MYHDVCSVLILYELFSVENYYDTKLVKRKKKYFSLNKPVRVIQIENLFFMNSVMNDFNCMDFISRGGFFLPGRTDCIRPSFFFFLCSFL